MSKVLAEKENCPPVNDDVDSETELVIKEVQELAKVKRPVGRPKKYLDPNHKYPNNYPRKNLYKHCEVCNKTCEYYHYKHHVKSRYHIKREAEKQTKNTNVITAGDDCDDNSEDLIIYSLKKLLSNTEKEQLLKCKDQIIQAISNL